MKVMARRALECSRLTGASVAAVPLANDIIALSDQVCGAPGVEIGERSSEIAHKRPNAGVAEAGLMQKILEQQVGALISSMTPRLTVLP
jgi:hypothetical protein